MCGNNRFIKGFYYKFDSQFRKNSNSTILGIDEAGRGPLAGPVVAVGVILPSTWSHPDIKDSKKLNETKRNELFKVIQKNALKIIIEISWEDEIDKLNILGATIECFKRIIGKVYPKPEIILIDGNPVPIKHYEIQYIKKGDLKSLSIASASIIAKVTRDKITSQFDIIFPEYGFKNHKGYGTKKHFEAIKKFGSLSIHRKSFNPVSQFLISVGNLNNRELGILGEKCAGVSIIKLGFKIIEMNYLVPKIGEIDIIHMENNELVFSEVKTIYNPSKLDNPASRITPKKAEKLMAVSRMYLDEKGFGGDIRFDVISVRFFGNNPYISRIKNGISL
jgi:ribonuclease HII